MNWQPIETAPKDGTAILICEGHFCNCVEWNEEFEWWAVDDNKLGPFRLRGKAPTHWMPLPAAPGATPAPAAVPLTDAQIKSAVASIFRSEHYSLDSYDRAVARAIEKAHGIAAVPGKGER